MLAADLAVVEALDVRLADQAVLRDACVAERRLVLAEGDPRRLRAVVLRRVHGERSPAAADVEHLVAGADQQLAADEVHLVVLALLKRVLLVAEKPGRIDHALAEEGLEEIVPPVVVPANEARVLG